MNTYGYANQNPVMHIDPLGLGPKGKGGGTGFGGKGKGATDAVSDIISSNLCQWGGINCKPPMIKKCVRRLCCRIQDTSNSCPKPDCYTTGGDGDPIVIVDPSLYKCRCIKYKYIPNY